MNSEELAEAYEFGGGSTLVLQQQQQERSVARIAGNTNGRSYPYAPPSRPDCGHKYLADEHKNSGPG